MDDPNNSPDTVEVPRETARRMLQYLESICSSNNPYIGGSIHMDAIALEQALSSDTEDSQSTDETENFDVESVPGNEVEDLFSRLLRGRGDNSFIHESLAIHWIAGETDFTRGQAQQLVEEYAEYTSDVHSNKVINGCTLFS